MSRDVVGVRVEPRHDVVACGRCAHGFVAAVGR
jgi:hypothetical protein